MTVADYETALAQGERLEIRLWLRLLTCTNLIEGRVRRGLRQDFDTTLPRFDLMAQLDRAPDGLSLSQLSRRLMVSNGNVTGLVERLVAEGLVESRPDPGDRRTQLVRLTAAGHTAFQAMTPVHERWIAELMAGLSRAEMAQLHELLAKLKRSAAAAQED